MRWWDAGPIAFDYFVEGLQYINESSRIARDFHRYKEDSDALAAFAKGYVLARFGELGPPNIFQNNEGSVLEGATIRKYMFDGFDRSTLQNLLSAPNVLELVGLRPLIYDEDVVDKASRRLNVRKDELSPPIFEGARRRHRAFVDAHQRAMINPTESALRLAGENLGRLLYLIRCNLNHPGKTRSGPDTSKAARDHKVVSVALPVLRSVLDIGLDAASSRIGVYGSLRIGADNHHRIADLGEVIAEGVVLGRTIIRDGFPVVSWDNSGEPISVQVFESDRLNSQKWDELDDWEGLNYRRIVVPVRLSDDSHLPAMIYSDVRA